MNKEKLPGKIGNIKIESVEPIKFTDEQHRLLGELWDWQRQSAKSDYIFTDKPQPYMY